MGIRTASTPKLPDRIWMESALAAALLALAVVGLWTAIDGELWKEIAEQSAGATIARLTPQGALVRVRNGDAGVWEDLTAEARVAQGDAIFTDESGTASLKMLAGDLIAIGPGSLVIVRVDEKSEKAARWGDLANRASIEVKQGTVSVQQKSSTRGVKLSAGGKTYEVSGEGAGSPVVIEADASGVRFRSGDGKAISVKPQGAAEAKRISGDRELRNDGKDFSEHPAPPTPMKVPAAPALMLDAPSIISPAPGAEIAALPGKQVEVSFKWAEFPRGSQGDVEVRSEADQKVTRIDGGRFGAVESFTTGTYSWRVRALGAGGKSSPWSVSQRLVLTPKPRARPLALTQVSTEKAHAYKVAAQAKSDASRRDDIKLLPIPVPAEPREGQMIKVGARAMLTWPRASGGVMFELQVSSDAQFKQIVFKASTKENFQAFFPKSGGFYYWRVRGIYRGIKKTQTGPWGPVRKLEAIAPENTVY